MASFHLIIKLIPRDFFCERVSPWTNGVLKSLTEGKNSDLPPWEEEEKLERVQKETRDKEEMFSFIAVIARRTAGVVVINSERTSFAPWLYLLTAWWCPTDLDESRIAAHSNSSPCPGVMSVQLTRCHPTEYISFQLQTHS